MSQQLLMFTFIVDVSQVGMRREENKSFIPYVSYFMCQWYVNELFNLPLSCHDSLPYNGYTCTCSIKNGIANKLYVGAQTDDITWYNQAFTNIFLQTVGLGQNLVSSTHWSFIRRRVVISLNDCITSSTSDILISITC